AHPPSEIATTTIISAEEQLAGWYAQLRQARQPDRVVRAYERLAVTIRFYTGIHLLLFTLPAVSRYQQLLQMKLNVGKMDLASAPSRWSTGPLSSPATCGTSGASRT